MCPEGALHRAGFWDGASALAGRLMALGLARGERLTVLLPAGPGVHVALLAAELAGLVAVGLGFRSGWQELDHLLAASGASALVAGEEHGGRSVEEACARLRRGQAGQGSAAARGRRGEPAIGVEEV